MYGGGLMTFLGPSSSISLSRFLSCESTRAGGGMYHDGYGTAHLTVRNSLFDNNSADTTSISHSDLGGGGFKDYRGSDYTSKYSFSFFTRNIADTNCGHDIAIRKNQLSEGNIISCFTTTAINAFSNAGDNETNWLPQDNGKAKLFAAESERGPHLSIIR